MPSPVTAKGNNSEYWYWSKVISSPPPDGIGRLYKSPPLRGFTLSVSWAYPGVKVCCGAQVRVAHTPRLDAAVARVRQVLPVGRHPGSVTVVPPKVSETRVVAAACAEGTGLSGENDKPAARATGTRRNAIRRRGRMSSHARHRRTGAVAERPGEGAGAQKSPDPPFQAGP
jgi:hypothetical protein